MIVLDLSLFIFFIHNLISLENTDSNIDNYIDEKITENQKYHNVIKTVLKNLELQAISFFENNCCL